MTPPLAMMLDYNITVVIVANAFCIAHLARLIYESQSRVETITWLCNLCSKRSFQNTSKHLYLLIRRKVPDCVTSSFLHEVFMSLPCFGEGNEIQVIPSFLTCYVQVGSDSG